MEEGKKKRRRKTTALDRAVLRFQESGKEGTFRRIYHEIRPTVMYVAKRFEHLFSDRNADDLMQEGLIHISRKVIPNFDPERAGFKTLVAIAVTNRFRTMVKKIMSEEHSPLGIPVITFTEYELMNPERMQEMDDGVDIMDGILVDDFLRLFKERLTRESWSIYWRLYRDPKSKFKFMAKEMGMSTISLYRKSKSIYSFLKMLVDREGSDD